jgi:alcohol dehydrogenase class IV
MSMPRVLKEFLHRLQLRVLELLIRLTGGRRPILLSGPGSAVQLCQTMAELGARRVLIVTDGVLAKIGIVAPLAGALEAAGASVVVYDGVEPDPTHAQIETGVALGRQNRCDAVLAVGGGSPMDAAKVIAACLANDCRVADLIGNFKVKQPPLPIYAVPTTAGTGSEVTAVAVVTDTVARTKTPVVDGKLVPVMAAIDASLMTGLPPAVTAATGMDALTHAVESYISQFANDDTKPLSVAAVKLIFQNLEKACTQGGDLAARQAMALASTWAGFAFTRASVGYVHAIAHNLGGIYHTPHGLANAIVLPHVLDFSRDAAAERLAELAAAIGAADPAQPVQARAQHFIDRVVALARTVGIPEKLAALRAEDIPEIARRALAEAQGFYPVPRFMVQSDCEALLTKLLP